jgi:hypothetical protein
MPDRIGKVQAPRCEPAARTRQALGRVFFSRIDIGASIASKLEGVSVRAHFRSEVFGNKFGNKFVPNADVSFTKSGAGLMA